ncbi:hypothetical protein V5O48_015839 [Marasmius crinis-equi]|uniref:Uncharacterized protein n=1 Tax=Marasmius crinis-equi TaxID=585013 RepID=A0ABR3ETG4_9AGAR
MSEYYEVSGTFSRTATQTTSSTVVGLGYLSGRAIKRLGEAVLNGVDYILVNRQLKRMESYFAGQWNEESTDTREMCRLLIEFTHHGYILSVRTRSLCLIMKQIGAARFKGLVGALEDINDTSTYYRHLTEVWRCVNPSDAASNLVGNAPEGERTTQQKALAHLGATRGAYLWAAIHHGLIEPCCDSAPFFHTLDQNIPLILYFASIASIENPDNARLLIDIAVFEHLESVGVFDATSEGRGIMAGQLLLEVLGRRLGPEFNSAIRERYPDSVVTWRHLEHIQISAKPLQITIPEFVNTGSSPASGELIKLLLLGYSESGKLSTPREQLLRSYFGPHSSRSATEQLEIYQESLCTALLSPTKKMAQEFVDSGTSPVNVLLVGCSKSGKSTFRKQLTRSYLGPRSFRNTYQLDMYQESLYTDVLSFVKAAGLREDWAALENVHGIDDLNNYIISTWGYHVLQVLADEDERHRLISFKHVAELSPTEREVYNPSDEELLRWYIRTTELSKESFLIGNQVYDIWECGEVGSEQRELARSFRNARVVIMVVPLDYNNHCTEGRKVVGDSLVLQNTMQTHKSVFSEPHDGIYEPI